MCIINNSYNSIFVNTYIFHVHENMHNRLCLDRNLTVIGILARTECFTKTTFLLIKKFYTAIKIKRSHSLILHLLGI